MEIFCTSYLSSVELSKQPEWRYRRLLFVVVVVVDDQALGFLMRSVESICSVQQATRHKASVADINGKESRLAANWQSLLCLQS